MITVREQPTEPVQPGWILRSEVKQNALEAFTEFTRLQTSWIDQSGPIDAEAKSYSDIATAEICGAQMFMQMLFDRMESE